MSDFEYREQAFQSPEFRFGDDRFVEITEIFKGMDTNEQESLQERIYENYASAMRRRNREPLDSDRFQSHFFGGSNREKSIAFGGPNDGYLMGSEINGVFVPTHFSPNGLKEGYRLIKNVLHEDKPTALFITQDLVDTIRKMEGWKVLPFKINAKYQGVEVEKTMVVNNWSAIPRLASHQIEQTVSNGLIRARSLLNQLGEKAKQIVKRPDVNATDLEPEIKKTVNLPNFNYETDIKPVKLIPEPIDYDDAD